MNQEVKRGEIYWVDWHPARGSEQSGLRPSLVIQNDVGNKYSSTTIVAGITTAAERPYPFLIRVSPQESGLTKESSINLSAILTIDKTRLGNKCGFLSESVMRKIDQAIKTSLGLT